MHETTNRCNGHIQVSSPAGKATKRDRKGCKKGKIEAIMKNSMGSTKTKSHIDSIFKKKTKLLNTLNRFSGGNATSAGGISFSGITAGSIIKNEIIDDPYTFTDCEPQTPQSSVGLYLTSGLINIGSGSVGNCLSSSRKEQLQPQSNNVNHQLITNNSIVNSSSSNCVSGSINRNNIISSSSSYNKNGNNVNASVNGNVQVLRSGDNKTESTNDNNFSSNNNNNNINKIKTNSNIVNSNSNNSNTSVNVFKAVTTSVPLKQLNTVNNNNNLYTYKKSINSSTGCTVSRSNSGTAIASSSSSNSSSSSSSTTSSNSSSSVNSSNCIIDGSSKTMNKLQADIARKKVIVKRRRVVCQQTSSSSHDQGDNNSVGNFTVVKTEPVLSSHMKQQQQHQQHHPRTFARVSIPAKRLHRQTTWQRERRIRHEALQRIQDAQLQAASVKRDLFPLGLDVTDSEDDDITSMDDDDEEIYQRHWFMGCGIDYQTAGYSISGRESRLNQLRSELRRRLRQVWHGLERRGEPLPSMVSAVVTAARTQPVATAMLINPHRFLFTNNHKLSRAKLSMLDVRQCSLCERKALPCTRHCTRHIMYNIDQQLFQYCSWKSDDKTQCRVPVFDVAHLAPLCPQHARKQDNNFKILPDASSKKSRKKSKASTLTRSTKRGKKKKKKSSVVNTSGTGGINNSNCNSNSVVNSNGNVNNSNSGSGNLDVITERRNINDMEIASSSPISALVSGTTGHLIQSMATGSANTTVAAATNVMVAGLSDSIERRHSDLLSSSSMTPSSVSSTTSSSSSSCIPISQVEIQVQLEDVVEEVPEEVLAIASLDPAELASQASRLLEDQDLTNMLNIPADAFNDLFTEDKNGEYEPTREETEELERALEAVDNDVRSLERMTRSMPALPLTLPLETMSTLLDDPTVSSAIPGVYAGVGYANGFVSSVQTDLRHS